LSALRRDDFSLHQVEFARGRHFNCFVGLGSASAWVTSAVKMALASPAAAATS
jgi:hypothetical protein